MSTEPQAPATVDEWRQQYQEHLAAVVEHLTAAARLRVPQLEVEGTDQTDWAEFVTLALAGAAANLGGTEAALSGRSGSWEAEGVRQLLYSTVGHDEALLWEHRTEPVTITLYVDEILVDACDAHTQYQDAEAAIARRYERAEAALAPIDYSHYTWEYHRNESGALVPQDPAAPAWSLEAWRASALEGGASPETVDRLAESLAPVASGAFIPKSPELAAELKVLETQRDAQLDPLADLEDALEAQRLREWAAYGEALKERVLAAAAALPGLTVPVEVEVDVETFRRHPAFAGDDLLTLADRLVDQAVMDTPTPADLPGTPLERLDSAAR